MEPGRLRQVLHLQSKQETRGAAGGVVQAFLTYATVRGNILPISGREFARAGQQQADVTFRGPIRYNKDVKREDQIILQESSAPDRTLDILAVRDLDERKRWQELDCKEAK